MFVKCKNLLLVAMITFIAAGGVFAAEIKSSPKAATGDKKLFSFAVIADIQYADKANSGARHFRKSLENLKKAVKDINGQKPAFTIQLGDIIDGNKSAKKTHEDLDKILAEYNKLNMPKYHVLGNHCLAGGKKHTLHKLQLKKGYYDFTSPKAKGWRFIVIDGNEKGYGVLSKQQLKWLKSTLEKASNNKEKVIVFCHYALLKKAAPRHRMQKPEPVLKLIENSGCVVAYFAGHDHIGGYVLKNGIHHITVKGMVEAPKKNSYAIINVYPGKLKEVGHGKEPSRVMKLKTANRKHERENNAD